jgi:hypothetical protein
MSNLINLIESAFGYGRGRKKDGHWPSEATACPRQVVYNWQGTTESDPIEPGGWWKIKLGSAIHELCQSTLIEIEADPDKLKDLAWEGFHVETEVRSGKVPVPGLVFPISYRMDITFIDDDGVKALCEFKTAFGFGMRAIKEEGPKDSAMAQTICYMALSGIRRGYIMYVSRDNADRVLFQIDHVYDRRLQGNMSEEEVAAADPNAWVEPGILEIEKGWRLSRMFPSGDLSVMKEYTPELWPKIIAKFKFIEDCVKGSMLPERPYKVAIKNGEIRDKFVKGGITFKSDWQCMYCSFMKKCWGEIAAEYTDSDNSEDFKEATDGGNSEAD